jgi:OmpA-OmpF porin, OOP family
MKCNPVRWLWGLVPLLGLGGLMYLSGAFAGIESDLKQRAEKALVDGEHGWATVAMSGRDATLIGEAVDNSDQLRAAGIVRSVWNVRKLDDQTKLLDEEKNYVWGAQLQSDGSVRLSGFVPSPATRQAIVGAAKATFPSRSVDDRMKLARGAPAQAVWEGGISFALKQLAALKPGSRVDLDAANLLIEGEAEDLTSFKGVKTALQTTLPQGVRLRSDKVTPPVVKPYTWAARLAANQVQLTGHVPSERARDEIFAAAKKAFPKAAVVDRLQIAAGEPKEWLPSVLAAVAKLGRLEEGSIDMRDAELSIAGLAADEATAADIRRSLKSDVPPSFKTTEALRIKEVPLKTIDPFTTGITAANGVVILSGYVPSPAAKAALLEATKARLPGQRIDDKLEIANGAHDGWPACVQSGLLGLGRLGAGRMQMTGRTLALQGQTDSEPLSQGVAVEVQNAAGQACATDVKVAFTGIPSDELKRRAEAAAARAAAEEAARKSAAEAAAAKAAADAAAAKEAADAAARAAAAQPAPAPVAPPPVVAVAPPPPPAAPAPTQAQAEAINCQTLLTQVQNDGVINFKRASAELDRQSNATLDKIAGVMASCKSARIEVQGHTDAEGTPERNINLSNRRAQSVLDYLSAAGVEPARLTAVGYGETRPVAPNDTRENRARNRRIEFEVRKE